jgi:putative membrane protein
MLGFWIRLAITALGLALAEGLISSLYFTSPLTLLLAALLLGLVNAFVRPLLVLLTLPITVLSLGLFLWVINAAMLILVASLLDGFHLGGFSSALLGSAVVSVTSWVASWYVGPRGRIEVLVVDR